MKRGNTSVSSSQKIAFMVALGLVTTEHLEGRSAAGRLGLALRTGGGGRVVCWNQPGAVGLSPPGQRAVPEGEPASGRPAPVPAMAASPGLLEGSVPGASGGEAT